MAKKNLGKVQADLAQLAGAMPSQRVEKGGEGRAIAKRARPTPTPAEEMVQFSLSLRRSLHKELARLAMDGDMTMRAFVLNALKGKGLSVTNADLKDLRKR